jgi:hypothetical protein
MGRTLLLFWALLGAGFYGLESLRAEGLGAEITQVKIEEYLTSKPVRTEDPMIRFERRYLVWGAINSADYLAREGKYFTIFWKVKDRSSGVKVRMEYLQSMTGRKVHVQEVAVDQPCRGNNAADFQVIGTDYHKNGDVLAWKATILRDGVVLAERRSFLWKDP